MASSPMLPLPLGALAAILTTVEFVLSVVAALSAHAVLHGLWISRLRRRRRAPVARVRARDALAMAVSVALVVCVALVETDLMMGYVIGEGEGPRTDCVAVDGTFLTNRTKLNPPLFRVTVEEWVRLIVPRLGCGSAVHQMGAILSSGIGSVGVERGQVPVCRRGVRARTDGFGVGAVFGRVVVKEKGLNADPFPNDDDLGTELSEGAVIWPKEGSRIVRDVTKNGEPEGKGRCGDIGISSYRFRISAEFATRARHAEAVTAEVLGINCKLHAAKYGSGRVSNASVLQQSELSDCVTVPFIDVPCLRSKSKAGTTRFVVRLEDVSALFLPRTVSGVSVACTIADIDVEYVFISADLVKDFTFSGKPPTATKLPILVPTSMRVVRGHCEQTVAALARAALLYSAESVWDGDEIGTEFGHVERYHAYMMSTSSGQYPLNLLRAPEDPTAGGSCRTRLVKDVTIIPAGWRLNALIVVVAFAIFLSLGGLWLRFWYRGGLWAVGSPSWSLQSALRRSRAMTTRGGNGELHVEVVAAQPGSGRGGSPAGSAREAGTRGFPRAPSGAYGLARAGTFSSSRDDYVLWAGDEAQGPTGPIVEEENPHWPGEGNRI